MSHLSYELVARISKMRGLAGEVTATYARDLPFCLHEGLDVFVVPPLLYGPRRLTISSVRRLDDSNVALGFEQLSDADAASELSGHWLLVAQDELEFEDPYDEQWAIGFEVVDERYGSLGTVSEIIQTPANDVWVVNGPYGEVLVPVIDDTIVSLPESDDEPITTKIMDGLIDS